MWYAMPGKSESYAVFGGDAYYPLGGWSDLLQIFPDIEAAEAFAEEFSGRGCAKWAQVVDMQEWSVIGEWENGKKRSKEPE